ncbi:MAG: hypothetical protein DDG60_13020 [Anaerolineae bacterium]|nr:MAG: hypothetical protein DDG60_13020 [Anaerolineae bacterium]
MLISIGHTGPTLLGDIWLAVSEIGLVAVEFPATQEAFSGALARQHAAQIVFDPHQTADAVQQVCEYLSGQRRVFTLPLDWSGFRPFQRLVLQLTCQIPYGETRSYRDLAVQAGNPRAARAVARVQATNPMPLVIPCHRVIGADGTLRGYGGGEGLVTKQRLLDLEKGNLPVT